MLYCIDKFRILLCFIFLLWEGLLDLKKKKILLSGVFVFFALGIVICAFQGWEDCIFSLAGASIGGIVLLLAWITGGKIGYGDGFVLLATGALLGVWVNLLMLLLGLFLASLKAIWMLVSRHGGKNTQMPFVPFLIPGLTLSLAIITGSGL